MDEPVPALDYTATAQRPQHHELPEGVRLAIDRASGSAVVRAEAPPGSGFSGGFAAVVHLADGRCVFAKAGSSVNQHLVTAYAQEAAVLRALPDSVPAPRFVGSVALAPGDADEHAWQVVVAERVRGRLPQPWTEPDLAAVHEACLASAAALTPVPSGLTAPSMADGYGRDEGVLAAFAALRSGSVPLTWGQPSWLPQRWDELDDLVQGAAPLLDGETACHCDLRADNLLVDGGQAMLLDWNWLGRGAAWTDFVGLLPPARADGIDVDAWLRRSELTRDVNPAAVDAWLAVIAAYMLDGADDPIWPGGTQAIRIHQRRFARTFLDWLGARRGWA